VLILSGYDESTCCASSAATKCGFLQKPFSAARLAQKIREVLKEKPAPPRVA